MTPSRTAHVTREVALSPAPTPSADIHKSHTLNTRLLGLCIQVVRSGFHVVAENQFAVCYEWSLHTESAHPGREVFCNTQKQIVEAETVDCSSRTLSPLNSPLSFFSARFALSFETFSNRQFHMLNQRRHWDLAPRESVLQRTKLYEPKLSTRAVHKFTAAGLHLTNSPDIVAQRRIRGQPSYS